MPPMLLYGAEINGASARHLYGEENVSNRHEM